jgi:hypothetical protein
VPLSILEPSQASTTPGIQLGSDAIWSSTGPQPQLARAVFSQMQHTIRTREQAAQTRLIAGSYHRQRRARGGFLTPEAEL